MDYYRAVERYLYEYKQLKMFVEDAEEAIIKMSNEIQGVSAVDYSKESGGKTYKINSGVELEALKLTEKKEILKQRVEKAKCIIKKIDRALETLNETERDILKLYYIENLPWFKVSWQVHLSERQCRNIRRRAINRMVVAMFGVGYEEKMRKVK